MTFREMIRETYINACMDILQHGSPEDSDAAACAIRDGYIRKEPDGSFFVTSPAFTKEQKEKFDAIAGLCLRCAASKSLTDART